MRRKFSLFFISLRCEAYVWSFQYKILNFILFTNDKLFKIGLSNSDKCSFSGTYTEDLYHLFFNCSFVQAFWNVFTVWWSDLSGEYLTLSLKDIMVGLLQRNDLLKYLIILGKLTIWECRKNNTSLLFRLFLHKVEVKEQVESFVIFKLDGSLSYKFCLPFFLRKRMEDQCINLDLIFFFYLLVY